LKAAAATLLRRTLLSGRWEPILVIFIIGVGAWGVILSPYFLTRFNLLNEVVPFAGVMLLALGLTPVMLAGEIDISGPSAAALTSVVFAKLFAGGTNIVLAAIVAIALGMAGGLLNGSLIALLELPSFAVTLGTLAAFQGVSFVLLGTGTISGFPNGFLELGNGTLFGHAQIPVALFILLGATAVIGVIVHLSRFGRYTYMIGFNRTAAHYAGVPTIRVRITLFVLSGLMASLAGLFYASFFSTVKADSASGGLLDAVTAVVLGGVSIYGGIGTILGVALAFILVATVRSAMGLANISAPIQDIAVGVLLIASLVAGGAVRRLSRVRRPARSREEVKAPSSGVVPG
jgi:rhamnose transport system permease protein